MDPSELLILGENEDRVPRLGTRRTFGIFKDLMDGTLSGFVRCPTLPCFTKPIEFQSVDQVRDFG